MKKKQNSGFTLIELAIVLVIIGLIVGAVLKGQDLIDNAKAKKFISNTRAWEISQWTYLDRKGSFAGDDDLDGNIGDGDTKQDLIDAAFTNPPYGGATGSEVNTISMGSMTFSVFFGTDGGADAGRNVIILCNSATCDTLSTAELVYLESLDVTIDGVAAGDAGQVIGVNSAPTITLADWEAYYSSTPTPAAWSTSTRALVYYFDAKR